MRKVHFYTRGAMSGTCCGKLVGGEEITTVIESVNCAKCISEMDTMQIKVPKWQIDRFVYGVPESECPNPNAKK